MRFANLAVVSPRFLILPSPYSTLHDSCVQNVLFTHMLAVLPHCLVARFVLEIVSFEVFACWHVMSHSML